MNPGRALTGLLFLGAGIIIGVSIELYVLQGVNAASLLFGGLGVAILIGQLAIGYRQSHAEEESRQHELRLRNEDLFTYHSRSLAEQSLLRLRDIWASDPPPQAFVYRTDGSGAGEPVDSMPNWEFARKHLLQEPETGILWKQVESAITAYREAYGKWETRFQELLSTLIKEQLGEGFLPGKPWGKAAPARGYDPDTIRTTVRWAEQGTPHPAPTPGPAGQGITGLSLGGQGVGFFAKDPTILKPEQIEVILRKLELDETLTTLRGAEDEAKECADTVLVPARESLRIYAERVHLSGRLAGMCDVCAPLVPRISSGRP
jgi:hypothetical protein